jgi:hypothetical protein|tara:strand:+ start:247 stop:501 length:255 start_codon:yes stop_codon:yes gene_type:complete
MGLKTLTKNIKKALAKGHLYSNEEYAKLQQQYRELMKLRRIQTNNEKALYGFGYEHQSTISESDYSDPRSGEDDGVRSEGKQPL